MRAMVVEVGPEIEQLVFEICRRPEQQVIQILSAKGADEHLSPLDESACNPKPKSWRQTG